MQPLRIVCVSSCLIGLAATPLAQAEEGEFQLGLGTPFLGYSSYTEDPDNGEESSISGLTWGIGHEVFAELGYGITPSLVLGGLVQLGGTSMTSETGDNEVDSGSFELLLGPKLDFVLMPGDKVQPFVGGVIGYVNSSTSTEFENVETSTSTSGFMFMARGGVRIFPGKEFSIDPWLGLGYFTGGVEYEGEDNSVENDLSGFELMVHLTVSGWMD